jgi:eukaryotic-like serine/threonine-protein kinase
MNTMVSTATGTPESAAPDVLPPGAMAGPWRVEHVLGRGGMGTVYAVVHDEIGKRAALKLMHQRLSSRHLNVDRMLLEAKVVNQVGHPNIVDIFETGALADGRPYIVMERLTGMPLSERVAATKLLPDQVISILKQICDALIAAHAQGVIHRDLKLDNVFLVDTEDGTSRVKLLDWGIAKVIDADVKHTIEGQLVGTPQYLAPEQARAAAVSSKTDVYSLGVMAYELFLEQLPFEAETAAEIMTMHLRQPPPLPSELWPDIPPELERLLLQMLAKKQDARPTTDEVVERLDLIADELHRRRDSLASLPVRAPTARPSIDVGFAETKLASKRARRWGYLAGVSAMAASLALLVFSRNGDSASAAAATTAEVKPPPVKAPPPATPAVTADAPPAATFAVIDVHEPTPTITPAVVAPTKPTPAHRAAQRPVPRKAPVTSPRRPLHIDPDGTIDVYR